MKRNSNSNSNNNHHALKGSKNMKRNSNSNNNQSNSNNNEKGEKTMKRNSNSNSNATNNSNEKGEKTMKRNSNSNSNATNNNQSNNNQSNATATALQILATLDPAILKAIGLSQEKTTENLREKESEASEAKSQKADRTYEIQSIGADFVKSGIYAKPKSEDAGRYMAKAKALCSDVINNLTAPIASDIKAIADRAEKNGGDTLKADLLQLTEKWEIPAQAMRVIMQLCAPVVGVCNPETDEIARRVYGMGRANSLMGSACNTLMYSKSSDKEKALPFKRVAHNITALGLDFCECESVEECDFCDSDEEFEELVELCDMWLEKCTPKSSPEKSALRRTAKSSPEKSEDKSAAILAALQALLGK